MPGNFQLSPDLLVEELRAAAELGLGGVLLFGIPAEKDATGSDAVSDAGIIAQAVRAAKAGRARDADDHRRVLLRIHGSRALRADRPRRPAGRTSTTTPRWNFWPGRRWSTPGPAPTWWPPAA